MMSDVQSAAMRVRDCFVVVLVSLECWWWM